MGEYSVKRPLKRPPVHPGELLREDVLPALGLSVSEAARRLIRFKSCQALQGESTSPPSPWVMYLNSSGLGALSVPTGYVR
jgi:hypothetical protein